MNDPGLDQPIAESAEKVQEERQEEGEIEKEDEQAFLDPRSNPPSTLTRKKAPANGSMQSLVVRVNGLSTARCTYIESYAILGDWLRDVVGDIRPNGQRLQHLRPDRALEGLDTSWIWG